MKQEVQKNKKLTKVIGERGLSWIQVLLFVFLAMRGHSHGATGLSPHSIFTDSPVAMRIAVTVIPRNVMLSGVLSVNAIVLVALRGFRCLTSNFEKITSIITVLDKICN